MQLTQAAHAAHPAIPPQVDRDAAIVNDLGIKLTLALNTHCHADHVTGTHALKQRFPGLRSAIAAASGAAADVKLRHLDVVTFGSIQLEARVMRGGAPLPWWAALMRVLVFGAVQVRATPGHTDGCLTYVLPGCAAFTGDALLIRGCGRTDFQQGNAGALYDNVHAHILSLPPATRLYVGHDYQGRLVSSVGEELSLNARLTKSREDFITLMANLNLPYPKRIDVALPANLADGAPEAAPAAL